MSTIEELKAIPKVLDNLLNEETIISNKIHSYVKIFTDIIKGSSGLYDPWHEHICNLRISTDKVTFDVKRDGDDEYDEEDGKHYEFPLELFVSSQTFNIFIYNIKEKERQEKIRKRQN
jgi:hypothetical protein